MLLKMQNIIIHFEHATSEAKTAYRATDARTNQQYVAKRV